MKSELVRSVKAFSFIIILSAIYNEVVAQKALFFFETPKEEINSFRHFDPNAEGINPVNSFLLVKMSQMMYLEQLDYQLRFLQNDRKPVSDIPSTVWLRKNLKVTDLNFAEAYKRRFQHYFYDPSKMPAPERSEDVGLVCNSTAVFDHCYWQDSIQWAQENMPEFHFIHKTEYWDKKKKHGIDPELIVISTKTYILIVFRGTDKVEGNEWSEWTGTDFKIGQVRAGGSLMKARVHKGFWQSFDLIRDELIRTLDRCGAHNKKIWLTGHSLGGAMSMLTGVYLKSLNYPVQNVYAFAAPKVVGDKKFVKIADQLLPGKIHRFEYYLDPIALLWAPRYKHIGQRNWFDSKSLDNYKLHTNVKERYISLLPYQFRRHPFGDKRSKTEMRQKREMKNGLMTAVPFRFYYHNPQWYVEAAYNLLTEDQKAVLPGLDDTFPYLYESAKGPMLGTK